MNRSTLFLLLLFLFITGLAIGGIGFWQLHSIGLQESISIENKHYFNDEFYIYGKDAQGNPFLSEIMLQRKQRDTGEFTHFYTLELLAKGQYIEPKIQEKYLSSDIAPRGFLKKYVHMPSLDLSTRESFQLTVSANDTDYVLDTTTLEGDFIVRNKPNYSKYVNIGKGVVTANGSKFPVSLVHLSSYSENYSEFVYFNGFYQLDSVAHLLVLFDESGNTYLLDKSDVTSTQKNYRSHTWILRKDSNGNNKKAFAATITYEENEKPNMWMISIPGLDNSKLSFTVEYNNDRATGLATGTITDNKGVRNITGFALVTHY